MNCKHYLNSHFQEDLFLKLKTILKTMMMMLKRVMLMMLMRVMMMMMMYLHSALYQVSQMSFCRMNSSPAVEH